MIHLMANDYLSWLMMSTYPMVNDNGYLMNGLMVNLHWLIPMFTMRTDHV